MSHTSRSLNTKKNFAEDIQFAAALYSSALQTNRPFHYQDKDRNFIHYLPCYVRFLLKEIEKISAVDMEAELQGNIIFSFAYEEQYQPLIDKVTDPDEKKPAIMLQLNKDAPIFLKEGKGITMKKQKGFVQYVVRQKFKVNLRGHVFLTPFQELVMYLAVTAQSITAEDNEGGTHKFKFNCMDYCKTKQPDSFHIIRHLSNITFGHYRVVSAHMKAAFTHSRDYPDILQDQFCRICENHDEYKDEVKGKNKQKDKGEGDGNHLNSYSTKGNNDKEEIQPYQYAHFKIPIYRYPGTAILTIFVPIQILGAIGLVVFFQESSLSSRLATIATLILAFVAFIPTVNASIPQSPTIKLVQILIFMHLLAIFLLGTQSYLCKNKSDYNFIWQENAFFLVSALLNILTFLIVAFLFIIHKCLWQPGLKQPVPGLLTKNPKIKMEDWGNDECDKHFSKFTTDNVHFFQQKPSPRKDKK